MTPLLGFTPVTVLDDPMLTSRNAWLFQADARRVPLADEAVALIPTSPPYNVRWPYGQYGDDFPLAEYHALLGDAFRECWRVLRPGGTLALNLPPSILTATERAYPLGAWAQLHLREAGWLLAEPIAWVKAGKDGKPLAHSTAFGAPSTPYFRPTYELVIVARKLTHSRETSTAWPAGFLEMVKDTWTIPPAKAPRRGSGEPPPLPDELVRRLVLLFSDPGDIVFDPFLGSGTSAAVAVAEGRIGVGCDLSMPSLQRASDRVISATKAVEDLSPSGDRLPLPSCPICEGTMPTGRRNRDYCSDACRQRAYRRRKAS